MTVFRGQAELLARFRAGDPSALERVYRTYVDRIGGIVRFGFRLPSQGVTVRGVAETAHDVADLVQEVFVKAFSPAARRAFDGLRDYAPFLFAIARNVVVDWARRRGREIPTAWTELERADELEERSDEPAWADEATMAIVQSYVDGLDSELLRVHEVRYRDGLSQRDAADKLGIGRQRLRTLEARLRDGLRRELTARREGP
jgi:RNA polymerase sigma-70 factor (ECF subfamily)